MIVLDCRCTDASDALIADGRVEVKAPSAKLRRELPEHRLEELVERCRGLKPMPTAVVHPCSVESLTGAVEAAKQELIDTDPVRPRRRAAQDCRRTKSRPFPIQDRCYR